MILCLDIGNSQIYGGVFDGDELRLQFRKTSTARMSSDEFGLFLLAVLRENRIGADAIERICACSVVPDAVYSVRAGCQKYFDHTPLLLQPGVKTGLEISVRNPSEVGADRIADAVGAVSRYPGENLIVVDFGTATTVCAVSRERRFLGGNIVPGIRLAMESLEQNTAKLPSVEIQRPHTAVGRSTVESIQSGLYWMYVGMVRELVQRITDEVFDGRHPHVIGTGGFAYLFEREQLFDDIVPDLILRGLLVVQRLNCER